MDVLALKARMGTCGRVGRHSIKFEPILQVFSLCISEIGFWWIDLREKGRMYYIFAVGSAIVQEGEVGLACGGLSDSEARCGRFGKNRGS